ncbi:MAG: sugar phosphate nucleotidyltransferase, partial [Lentisphaerota bacterium]
MIKKKEDITAVILAGGMGARLRGVIGDSQKVLAQVNGAPFITYLLKQIASFRIRKVVLCTGYKAETVKEEIGENIFGLEISYSEEIEPLGTGGAIISALTKVSTEYLLIMNGDSFLDYNLNDLIK